MSIDLFIPSIWSGSILRNLHKAQVYASPIVCNRDYEGEISAAGNQVVINNIGPVTIGNYTKNTNISDPETLTSAQRILVIDQQKYFNFQVDDIDKAQTKPKVLDEAAYEAAYGFSDVGDQFVAGFYASATVTLGSDAAPLALTTAASAYENLIDMGVALDVANVPKGKRWVVLPAWYVGLMLKDPRFVSFATPAAIQALMMGQLPGAEGALADMDAVMNGQVGMAAGFKILQSNNVPNTADTKYKIIAGYPKAISFADQIIEVIAYRPEKRFGDAMKGLHVYGAKLVRPTGIAVATCNHA